MPTCAHDPWYKTIVGTISLVFAFLYTSYEAWVFFHQTPAQERTLAAYLKLMFTAQVMYLGVIAQDLLLLNAPWSTIEQCTKTGFSKKKQAAYTIFNAVMTKPYVHMILVFMQDEMEPRLDDWYVQIFKLLVVFAVSDYSFMVVHRWMHNAGCEFHVMHHCVHHASPIANWFVNPWDFVLEFAPALAPALLLFGTPFFGMRDPWMVFVSLTLQELAYPLGHDAFLKLAHYHHHTYISGTYHTYTQIRTKGDGKDKIRTMIYGTKAVAGEGIDRLNLKHD